MKIAVLGGGNGSFAAAVDLVELGHEVQFWRRDANAIKTLQAKDNTLTLKDAQGERLVKIGMVTNDIGKAIYNTELIVCPTPATAQRDIAKLLSDHLQSGQVVWLPPGSFGSLIMAQIVHENGNSQNISFAESGTLPYLTRLHGPDTIAITKRATRLPTGVFPHKNKDHALDVIGRAFSAVEDAGNGLSGALMNAGPIIHPPLIVMNAGPIEHFERWDIHNEGTQPAVRRITTQLDCERMNIREALGYGAPHFPLADHYNDDGDEWMYGRKVHDQLVDSGDWSEKLDLKTHRYMREDLGTGLAFLVSVANWANVPAPVATGLLSIGSGICEIDFRAKGRTLENLGLADKSKQQMKMLLEDGFNNG